MKTKLFILALSAVSLFGCTRPLGIDPYSSDAGPDPDASPPHDLGADLKPDAAPMCGRSHDSISIEAKTWDGIDFSCSFKSGSGQKQTYYGYVETASGNSFTISNCCRDCPCAELMPQTSAFTITAPDLPDLAEVLAIDGSVNVTIETRRPWGCYQRLIVESTYKAKPSELPYIVVNTGTIEPLPSELKVSTIALGCHANEVGCGGPAPDDYLFRASAGGNTADIKMGDNAYLKNPKSGQGLLLRNVRSFQSSYCDDYWNWAYYAVRELFID